MVRPDAIDEAIGTEQPGIDPSDHVIFTIDDDVCTRCALCVDRCLLVSSSWAKSAILRQKVMPTSEPIPTATDTECASARTGQRRRD